MNRLKRGYLRIYESLCGKIEKHFFRGLHCKHPNDYVLCFHDIADVESDIYSISEDEFYTVVHNINGTFISLENALSSSNNGKDINRYILSFDDGYESVFLLAYPILKRLNIPFVCYIATDFIGANGYMSSTQLKCISNDPLCTIGSHMCSHQMTREMSNELILHEWKSSKKILEGITNNNIEHAALPYGSRFACSRKSIRLALNLGYKSVATTSAWPLTYKKQIIGRYVYRRNINMPYLK